ncbi:MAG TPA: electron transfer flavoprotein subunit beta/FixA family protein [Bacteroidales bacterium]|nr:electron transfer flavoprotein subunit beta/FixA family protein [Bacteroidales bacterium]
MNILVCISQVPDTTTRIKFVDDNKRIETSGIQWIINPWDELALTRALELRDNPNIGVKQVSVVHVGLATSEPTIRKALAIGADNAYRVNIDPTDAFQTANALAAVVKKGSFDIILCGIESSDYNGSNVGGMLAELLDYPSVSAISSLSIDAGNVVITREIDGGKEVLNIPTPFVGIVQKGIAKEPRIAAMRGIMQARTKFINLVEASLVEPIVSVSGFEPPKARAACRFIDPDKPELLIELLQNEAKII